MVSDRGDRGLVINLNMQFLSKCLISFSACNCNMNRRLLWHLAMRSKLFGAFLLFCSAREFKFFEENLFTSDKHELFTANS
jgi:hypothetical protein